MKLSVPVYVETHPEEEGKKSYIVRPLFFRKPLRRHEKLERALHLLAQDLRLHLDDLGEDYRHDLLARWCFHPALATERLELRLELRRSTPTLKLLFVLFEALDRRLAFTPSLPDQCFEVLRGETLAQRAAEVLTAYFRSRERKAAGTSEGEEEDFVDPETVSLSGPAWVTGLEMEIEPTLTIGEEESRLASLGSSDEMAGWRELRRVGRCLDEGYPDDLDRAVHRPAQLEELITLLRGEDRRPVLILGPSRVGKSALIHEFVWQTAHGRRGQHHRQHNNVWLLAPQRLISGMMYVGQWENRLLAIIDEAKKRDHILYFDDLLGMYLAGQSCSSDLSVAQVLRPFIERRELRLLAEMTPEALRIFRERDRGFADLFQILPLAEPDEAATLRILLAVVRQLESQHRVTFDLEVLPAVIDLVRRFVRHQVFPGKAAVFLRRLAVKFRGTTITRQMTLEEFHAQSGLVMTMLDSQQQLDRDDLLSQLEVEVIGQPAALEAVADVIGIARARLNDPDRPLGSLLFLGPTGVGKTQCARAVARVLFGEADRLLRFDMNEFNAPGSSIRLAGTFDQPEGLLTAAVRRQPFAVILFDEIEKADPEVFDLLLQVLGEGRLTDALGRTVDFTSTLIVLTSNLGVREARQQFGFGGGESDRADVFVKAAERFFRPEFFNRLDRIVPFSQLGRDDMSRIARLLLRDLLNREGLVRRKCILRVEDDALEQIVQTGYDPVLGARALRRSVEKQLATPLAECLARGLATTMTVLSVYPGEQGQVILDVQGLDEVAALPETHRRLGDTEAVLADTERFLRRIESRFSPLRPREVIDASALSREQLHSFIIQEQGLALRGRVRELEERLTGSGGGRYPALPVSGRARTVRNLNRRMASLSGVWRDMATADDLNLYLDEMASKARRMPGGELLDLAEDAAVLEALAGACDDPEGDRVLLHLFSIGPRGRWYCERLSRGYLEKGFVRSARSSADARAEEEAWWQLEVTRVDLDYLLPERALVIRGPGARALTRFEVGTHLFALTSESLLAVQIEVYPLPEDMEPLVLLETKKQARRDWLATLARGDSQAHRDPFRPRSVVRVCNVGRNWIDLRTGQVEGELLDIPDLVRGSLDLPVELR